MKPRDLRLDVNAAARPSRFIASRMTSIARTVLSKALSASQKGAVGSQATEFSGL